MPSQTAEIHETIIALRRALRREKEAPSTEPIQSATNRGNKLKKGASYVHSGALPYPHGPEGYKQPIEHAGYTRYILDRNPKRYNDFGEELEDEDSDTEADIEAEEENPYGGVRLEELLSPLKHPSELADHPTLSTPFLDSAIPSMVQTTEEKLRQERANLWRAKKLHRQMIGDENWMPCQSLETSNDWDLFEPRPKAIEEQRKKRRRGEVEPTQNGVSEKDHALKVNGDGAANGVLDDGSNLADGDNAALNGTETPTTKRTEGEVPSKKAAIPADDIQMEDANTTDKGANTSLPQEAIDEGSKANTNHQTEDQPTNADDRTDQASQSQSPPPPSRRITRALAAEVSAPTPPLSLSPTISTISSSLLTPDPIFLLSRQTPNRTTTLLSTFGLPIDELLETRRLLSMYIQKQEETIRSTENVLGKLIKAKRMRDRVWEWSRAEGHVGELSDGEDWIDNEGWGLKKEELKKGKDEDENEEETIQGGRKGKRRRVRARDGGGD